MPLPDSTDQVAPNRWVFHLCLCAAAVVLLSVGVFYFTTRSVFARSAPAELPQRLDPMANVVSLQHGLAVYAANCATCHGPKGLGDGPAAENLNPKPRNFATGWFKFGTTRSGLPTDEDLIATIRRGMLPTAPMPPWPQLTDGEAKSLALAVRHLAVDGRVAEKLERDPNFSREKAIANAHAQLDPGPPISLPPRPAQIDPERGKTFYLANCAACHDPDGRGKLRTDLVDNDENPISPRDFTAGQFKGGKSVDDIAMRIVRGIPGTPMPANAAISAEDLWSTAAHVRELIREDNSTAAAAAAQTGARREVVK